MIIQALKKGLIEHEASDTGGVPRGKSSCPDRLAEATAHNKMRCPADRQQNDDKKGQTGDKPKKGEGKEPETKNRPQQGGWVSLQFFLPGGLA